MALQKGDRVIVIEDFSGQDRFIGQYGTVRVIHPTANPFEVSVTLDGGLGIAGYFKEFRLVSSANSKIMGKLTQLARKVLDPDYAALVDAGVLNDDLSVSDTDFVLAHYVEKNKSELADSARAILEERKKK